MDIGVKDPVLPTVETIHVPYIMELVSDVLQDGQTQPVAQVWSYLFFI